MGNRIGQAYIELTTKGEGRVKRAVRALTGELKTLDAQGKKTGGTLEGMGKGAEGVQSALGKLLMPVAFISAVAGVAGSITKMLADAQRFRRELADLTKEASRLDAALGQRTRGFTFTNADDAASLRDTNQQLEALTRRGQELEEQAKSDPLGTIFGSVANFVADDFILTTGEKIEELEAKQDKLSVKAKARQKAQARVDAEERERRADLIRLGTREQEAADIRARAASEENEERRKAMELEAARIEDEVRRARLTDEIQQLKRRGYDEEADALAEREKTLDAQHAREMARISLESEERATRIRTEAEDIVALTRAQNAALAGGEPHLVRILQLEQQIAKARRDGAEDFSEALEERLKIVVENAAKSFADANTKAIDTTFDRLADRMQSINNQQGPFSDMVALLHSVADNTKHLRGIRR